MALQLCSHDQVIGHDIGCTSRTTVANSSFRACAKDLDLLVTINAFHGFMHNWHCQLHNHPLYLPGFSLEDLKTCEQIFSSLNSTATLIHHLLLFHWIQFFDLHYDQWNQDKYLKLSMSEYMMLIVF